MPINFYSDIPTWVRIITQDMRKEAWESICATAQLYFLADARIKAER